MSIGDLLALLVEGGLLSGQESHDLEALPGPDVYGRLADKGRPWHKKLGQFLLERISPRPIEATEWTYQMALGRVAGARRIDSYLLEAVDEDLFAFFLWETRGQTLDESLASLAILAAARLLRQPIPPGPSGLVRQVNRVLSELEPGGAYTSVSVGLLDIRRGVVDYCCGGAPFPLLYRAGTREVEECRDGFGIPVGIERDSQYSTGYVILARGDVLLFSTDGLWKAAGSRGTVITSSQWRRRLREFAGRPPEGIRRGLQRELRMHLLHRRARDGATVAVIKRRGRAPVRYR